MIPAWNLAWIIPVSVYFGMVIMALIAVGHDDEDDDKS